MFDKTVIDTAKKGKHISLTPLLSNDELNELVAAGASKSDIVKFINTKTIGRANQIPDKSLDA